VANGGPEGVQFVGIFRRFNSGCAVSAPGRGRCPVSGLSKPVPGAGLRCTSVSVNQMGKPSIVYWRSSPPPSEILGGSVTSVVGCAIVAIATATLAGVLLELNRMRFSGLSCNNEIEIPLWALSTRTTTGVNLQNTSALSCECFINGSITNLTK
jgi:hypothetical protein